jgi:hypothetical protein
MEAEVGMLVVETIAKIRRAYFVHGQPINLRSSALPALSPLLVVNWLIRD